MKGRAIRREQEHNKKKKMKVLLRDILSYNKESITPKTIGLWAHTPQRCSNPVCCGNPRRTKGRINISFQERKHPLIEKGQQ